MKYSTKKTKAYTGENSIFSIKIHTKKWMQAGVISLFYDKKKKVVYSTKGEIEWENAVSRRTIRFSIEAKYTIFLTKKIKCQF